MVRSPECEVSVVMHGSIFSAEHLVYCSLDLSSLTPRLAKVLIHIAIVCRLVSYNYSVSKKDIVVHSLRSCGLQAKPL